MGGMGPLAGDQRYVLTVEIKGPKTAQQADELNKIVADLKKKLGGYVKLSITGSK
jgi:hypothetical protein